MPPIVSAPPLTQTLQSLTDDELLVGTRRLVGRSNQLLAELLAHLGEVEARGIHRIRACSSPRFPRGSSRWDPRQRGRHIPAAVRRAVFERDGNQCTYIADTGERCAETHHLELHHVIPFGAGGEHDVSNVTLRCAAHNALAAEQDFGRELVEQKRRSSRHEHASAMREELRQLTVEKSGR